MEEWKISQREEAWGTACKDSRCAAGEEEEKKRRPYKILSTTVLLTYHGVEVDAWQAFVSFVERPFIWLSGV